MINFTITIEQVESSNKPENADHPVVVSVKTDSKNPTPQETIYATTFHGIVKFVLQSFMQSQMGAEAIEGVMSDGLKTQLESMLKRHGVTGFKISEK